MGTSHPYTKRAKLLRLAMLLTILISQFSTANVAYAQETLEQYDNHTFIPFITNNGTVKATAGSAYTLNWTAADPNPNNAPYLPTYAKLPPASLACPTPSAGVGRAGDPLANAVFGNPKDSVESLAPPSMALGQIVPFEVKISVSGNTTPENGVIQFSPYWLTKTTNGEDFGFDPAYKVYCAFVDIADTAKIDPGNNAKVDSWTDSVVTPNNNAANEQIQGTIQVSGLDNGDSVIVEIWVVLKSTIPAGATGNVQTGLVGAQTVATPADTINTGNQTVPLLRVQEFFSGDADISVTKSDSPDPVVQGQQLTYVINVTNNLLLVGETPIANGVVVTDQLDPNTTFVSASGATCSASGQIVTCNVGALNPGQTVEITIVVNVSDTAPTGNDSSTNPEAGTCTAAGPGIDLCNQVSVTAINDDPNTANNSDSEPTNVLPTFVPNPSLSIVKTTNGDDGLLIPVGAVVTWSYLVNNGGNVALSNVTVTDDKLLATAIDCGDGSNMIASLAAGASATCTASGTAVAGAYANIGTATGTPPLGGDVSDSDPSSYYGSAPALDLVKTASAIDMTVVAPADRADTGDKVTYSFLIKNTGNVTLDTVELDDALVGFAGYACNDADGTLAPGETTTCGAIYALIQADIDTGFVANTATAYGNPPQGVPENRGDDVKDSDGTTTVIQQEPALLLDKTATPGAYDSVGDVISYEYLVTNSGNVRLAGPVTVADDKVTVNCPDVDTVGNGDGYLDPEESITCSASYTIVEGDLDNGSVTNIAKALAGDTYSNEDIETVVYVAVLSGLTVTKSVKWNGVTPDTGKTFQICIAGPSYLRGNCKIVDFEGGVLAWSDLIPGQYTVTETNPGSEWMVEITGSPVTLPIDGGNAQANVTNTRKLGSLQVTKTVNWNGLTLNTDSTFEICIAGPSFPAGDCKIASASGDVLTWDDLIPGAYTVSETDPGNEWTVVIDSSSVTVPSDGGQAKATVTNTKLPSPRITVTKLVSETESEQWSFVLRLDGGDAKTVNNDQPTATWENLEPNRSYILSEDEPGEGWVEGAFECTMDGVSTGEARAGGDIQLSVVPGDDVICVKHNADISGTDLDPITEPDGIFGLFLPAVSR